MVTRNEVDEWEQFYTWKRAFEFEQSSYFYYCERYSNTIKNIEIRNKLYDGN